MALVDPMLEMLAQATNATQKIAIKTPPKSISRQEIFGVVHT
jgi:hypothetical protein